jgi:hypothetical protein
VTRALPYLFAAVGPTLALWLAAPPERAAHGMAVPPFGWPSLLVSHTLSAVPLAAVLAGRLMRRAEFRVTPGLAVAGGVLTAVGGWYAAAALGHYLDADAAGFYTRSAARSVFCVLLATPWLIHLPPAGGWVGVPTAVALAFLLPGVYSAKLAGEKLDQAEGEYRLSRLVRTRELLTGVGDLDPDRAVKWAGRPPSVSRLRTAVEADIDRLTKQVTARPVRTLEYAQALIGLDRLAEAESLLRDRASDDPLARLVLGECLLLKERWTDSESALRAGLAAYLPTAAADPVAAARCVTAFDLLAENATKRGATGEREAVLREGLEKLPAQAAYFRFQLGRHYQLSGRPFDAVREFEAAVEADPNLQPQVEPPLRNIREHTPACLVGR